MASTPRDRLERTRASVEAAADEGEISDECAAALLEWADALDGDTVRHKYRDEDGQTQTFKPRSIDTYLTSLRICAEDGLDLLETTAAEFNDHMDALHDDVGKTKATLSSYQSAARTFYRYHDDLGVDPDTIDVFTPESESAVDETDMFEEHEVQALRSACAETGMPTRNRALLELLIFTGQRIRALVTLRVGDVDLEEGHLYLNDDYEREHGGLKGALARGRKRPMFGAQKYVRDYIEYHRREASDDDWLFIGDPSHWKTDPDDHWAVVSADQTLRRMGEAAGVDKPVNAHNFRHYCATVLYRDYDVDRDAIRMLLGHVEGSSTLEETYSHLFDDDYIRKMERQLGVADEDDDQSKAWTPDICTTCGEVLEDHHWRCPACSAVYGPGEDFEERLADARNETRERAIDSTESDIIKTLKVFGKAMGREDEMIEAIDQVNS